MAEVLAGIQAKAINVTQHAYARLQNVTADELHALTEREEMASEGVIVSMAVLCIIIGASWSVPVALRKRAAAQTVTEEDEDDEEPEASVSAKDAALFPFIGSAVLLSLYICYKMFPKDLFNALLSAYFLVVLTYAVAAFLKPIVKMGVLAGLLAIATSVGWWATRHFALNNLLGIAVCITSLWKVKLPNFFVSWVLLWGLFIYDIWWVFGTEVMVSVAKNVEAPMLLKVPKNFAEPFEPKNMVMLGLGDIVIPGFFIATALRYDYYRAGQVAAKTKKPAAVRYVYFVASLFFYVVGLVNTIGVMLLFQHAQPALLYLVPWITIGTLIVSVLFGDVFAFFRYDEEAKSPEAKEREQKRKEQREAEEKEVAELSVLKSLYNIVVVELFFVEPFRAKKKKE